MPHVYRGFYLWEVDQQHNKKIIRGFPHGAGGGMATFKEGIEHIRRMQLPQILNLFPQ